MTTGANVIAESIALQMKAAQTLVSKLAARPPRETSGSRSANRFEFQKDWVICTILELHLAGSDYLVICDYHEDVIVLNKEIEGDQGRFYQVKTLPGKRWTIARLTKQQKGSSILGKLYQNYLLGREKTESLHLVSDAHYDFTLADGTKATEQQTIKCRSEEHTSELQSH